MHPITLALYVISFPAAVFASWTLYRHLVHVARHFDRELTYTRIRRLEAAAGRHFRLAAALREADQDDTDHARLAVAAANAAWDLRRSSGMEATP